MLEGRILSLSLLNQSEFVASTLAGHVYRCCLDLASSRCATALLSMSHTSPITCVAVLQLPQVSNKSPFTLTGTQSGEIRLWETASFMCLQCARRPKSGAVQCLYALEGYGVMSGWEDGTIVGHNYEDISVQLWCLPSAHKVSE